MSDFDNLGGGLPPHAMALDAPFGDFAASLAVDGASVALDAPLGEFGASVGVDFAFDDCPGLRFFKRLPVTNCLRPFVGDLVDDFLEVVSDTFFPLSFSLPPR